MRKIFVSLAVAATVAASATPAPADGFARGWRRSGPPVGFISRDVITPFYVGYYGGHYSYYAPGPYARFITAPGCWAWQFGYRIWTC